MPDLSLVVELVSFLAQDPTQGRDAMDHVTTGGRADIFRVILTWPK